MIDWTLVLEWVGGILGWLIIGVGVSSLGWMLGFYPGDIEKEDRSLWQGGTALLWPVLLAVIVMACLLVLGAVIIFGLGTLVGKITSLGDKEDSK